MRSCRLACFLLGLWLGGSLFWVWLDTGSLRAVDRLLDQPNPAVAQQLETLGRADARPLLRYQVAEVNRWYAESWETVQLFFGTFLFFFLLFGTGEDKSSLLAVLLMVAIVVAQRFLLTAQLVGLDRTLDFTPNLSIQERNRFHAIHTVYYALEMLKWGLGLGLSAFLVWRRRRRSGNAGKEFNLVDKAYDGHVDR